MENSAISRNQFYETCIMHAKSNNTETKIGSDTDEVIENLFRSLLQRYQESLEEKNESFRVCF